MERREFLQATLGGVAATAIDQVAAGAAPAKRTIAIQVPIISFLDEGVEQVLDTFQERAAVNTIFVAAFAYSRGIAGRQLPGNPLPDHGKQQYDDFHGGNYAPFHAQYYHDTGVRPEDTRAPDHQGVDAIPQIIAAARKRGIRTLMWAEDVWRPDVPNVQKILEIDVHGKPSIRPCYNNPQYRNFLLGLTEDYMRSYETDGMMWCMEATGALSNALTFSTMGCFCPHCERKGAAQGIEMKRAREGFLELEKTLAAARDGRRPTDGHFVMLWRILLRHPEMLAWEHLWHSSLRDMYRALYGRVKSVNPALQAGWHIQHPNSFSFLFRAERDIHDFAGYSDFLKIVMYNNCAGERMASYLNTMRRGAFADFTPEELTTFEYRVMNYRERGIDEIPFTGFSADYVARETKRALEGAAGTGIPILPGVDIDVPTASDHSKSTPEGTRAAVAAALRDNPFGLVLSRKYSEMKLTNLSGAGQAIREAGAAG